MAIGRATRESGLLRLGASPRSMLQLLRAAKATAALEGRDFVLPDDVVSVAESVLAHRIILDRKAASAGETPQSVIRAIIAKIPVTPEVTASNNGTGRAGRKNASAMAAAPSPELPNPRRNSAAVALRDRLPGHLFSTRGWGLLGAGAVSLLAAQVMGRRDLLALAVLLLVLPLLSLAGIRVLKPRFQVYREFSPSPVETSARTTVRLAIGRTGAGTGHAIMEEHLPPRFGESPVFRFPARSAAGGTSRYEYHLRSGPARTVPDRARHGGVQRPLRAVPAPPRDRRRRHPHRDARRRRAPRDGTGRCPRTTTASRPRGPGPIRATTTS